MHAMSLVRKVPSNRRSVERLASVIGPDRYGRLRSAADAFGSRFSGRTLWNVNSTSVGGGVAEMLHALVGYVEDLGIAIRWLVIHGDAEFFAITKRVHNGIHGRGDHSRLGATEAEHAAGTGVLLPDPSDLAAFGGAVRDLLDDREERSRMGAAAHAYVRENFVGDLHLLRYAEVFTAVASRRAAQGAAR
jgi:glycosyltransferase involved in cell wall biosynthesis